jgi:hypothetical protein
LEPPYWEFQVQAVVEQRRRNDENDQQHKGKIQQWSDVDIAQGHQRIPLGKTAHRTYPGEPEDRLANLTMIL